MSGKLLDGLGDLHPRSRSDAYAIQDAMAEALGLPIGGWKVGAATEGIMAERALDEPIPGPVFKARCHAGPATLPAADFQIASLETEVAFCIQEELPPRDRPYRPADLVPSVVAHLAFDLTQSRFAEPPDVLAEVADAGNSGGAVIGPEIRNWRDLDLRRTPVSLRLDGGQPVKTYSGIWRREPLEVLAWLLNSLGRRNIGLARGQFVLTGSITEPRTVGPGSCATAVLARTAELRACIGHLR